MYYDKNLSEYIQSWVDKNHYSCNFNIIEYCMIHGYFSWNDTIDCDGNILDSIKVITREDFQNACDSYGIEVDCINF